MKHNPVGIGGSIIQESLIGSWKHNTGLEIEGKGRERKFMSEKRWIEYSDNNMYDLE